MMAAQVIIRSRGREYKKSRCLGSYGTLCIDSDYPQKAKTRLLHLTGPSGSLINTSLTENQESARMTLSIFESKYLIS